MKITLFGINHRMASIEKRERYFLDENQQNLFLSELKSDPQIYEAVILSTCNRTEVCVRTIDNSFQIQPYVELIAKIKKQKLNENDLKSFYCLRNEEAVEHLFRVASGIDSLVIGEKQILGQVRLAFERARERGILSKYFNILGNSCIRVGKKAQTETKISYGGSSVSWAALKLAEEKLYGLEDKTILLIGAGMMSKLALDQIANKGFKKIYIMNRSLDNAQKLVDRYGGNAVSFCDIKEVFPETDICICASGAPHYILDYTTVQKSMGHKKSSVVLIDISMPRNIDPRVSDLSEVMLYGIDDLNTVVQSNMAIRQKALTEVEQIISDKINEYENKIIRIDQPANLLEKA